MNLGILTRPDFLVFTAARVIGIGIRPLILYLAAVRGFPDFSDAFALFATAVAGSFVVFSNEAHIRLYRVAFNDRGDLVELFTATRFFIVGLVSHVIWFALAGALLLFIWTGSPWLAVFGLAVLIGEKMFDEFQRYYTYERNYIGWTINFGFRYGLPGLAVLAPLLVGIEPTLALYIAAYAVSCAAYLLLFERGRIALYARIYARSWRGGRALLSYARVFVTDLYANLAWSFLAGNLYLLDRMMIAQTSVGIGAYVFFCNVFNLAVFAHSTLYHTHRRAELIKDRAGLRHELFRLPNIAPPLAYVAVLLGVGWLLVTLEPAYAGFDPLLLGGLALYFYAQAVSLVVADFMFWRVRRLKLVAADLTLGALCLGAFFVLRLPAEAIPLLVSALVALRIFAYAWLWRGRTDLLPGSRVPEA